ARNRTGPKRSLAQPTEAMRQRRRSVSTWEAPAYVVGSSLRLCGAGRNAGERRAGRCGQIESNAIFGYISAHRSFGRILVATAGFSPGTCLTSSFQTSTTALAESAGV